MIEKLIEGVDYFVEFWQFPNYAADIFVDPNDDGTFTIVFNSRYTREQLMQHVPHEFVHILRNHFGDDRDRDEIEAEADELAPLVEVDTSGDVTVVSMVTPKPEPAPPAAAAADVPMIPHYMTLRGLTLGELNASESLLTFGMGNDAAKIRAAFLQALSDNEPLVVR